MKQAVEMLHAFHKAYGVDKTDRDTPGMVSVNIFKLRSDLIKEEYSEYLDACVDGEIFDIAKELADLAYVVIGTALAHGIHNFDEVFAEVHRSNMSKLGADGHPVRRVDGKVLKGPNYSPANLSEILKCP